LLGVRPPIGLAVVIFCIISMPFCGIASIAFIGLVYKYRNKLSVWLTCFNVIVGVMSIVITMFIPLPKAPPSIEAERFAKYRASYFHVMRLAKAGDLDDTSSNFCKQPPPELVYVSEGGCIFINSFNDGLKVEFQPIDKIYYKIIYIENDTDITHCGHRAHIAEKLEDQWYLCWQEW